jgi:hypothetical protein
MSEFGSIVPSAEDPQSMTTSASERPGEWITPEVSYVEPNRRFCAYCGRPIARRYWRVGTLAGELAYCEPAHAVRHTAASGAPGAT